MNRAIQRTTRIILPASLAAAAVLGGCTSMQEPTYAPTRGAVLGDNTPRTVAYPGGRYQLYGEGTTASPYYWVWIPAGTVHETRASGAAELLGVDPDRKQSEPTAAAADHAGRQLDGDAGPIPALRRRHDGGAVLLGMGAGRHDGRAATASAPHAVTASAGS